jgi:hypothetical protein
MGFKKTIALVLGLLIFWLLCISIFRENLGYGIRFFNDDYDRSVYALDGEWFLKGQIPYKDTISEYPQIPTYLFAVPYLFSDPNSSPDFNYWVFSTVISLISLGFLLGTILLLYQMLPIHKNRAFLMLLPAALYFSYNRFDILPSFLVLLSLFSLQQKKNVLAGIFLGVATLTKWYPALLFPLFLAYTFTTKRWIDWKMTLAFFLTCTIIITPTFLSGGLKALLVPYLFHAQRGFEQVSLPALIQKAFPNWFGSGPFLSILTYLFLALSVLPVPFLVLAHLDTIDRMVLWSGLILAVFILFSRIWSPQWLLWVLPLMILIAKTPADILWIVVYGVVNYLAFPLVFDRAGPESWQLIISGLFGFFILVRFAVVCYLRAGGVLPLRLSPMWQGKGDMEKSNCWPK